MDADAVAGQAPEPSDTAETDAEAEKPRWRAKIPTKLLATLLGIALTAWLLPAFTRQWDDRQKAHELKVTLVDDTASASATATVRSLGTTRAKRAAAWFRASDSIEARLGAYFGPGVVAAWQIYSYLVDELLEAGGDAQATSTLLRALIWLYGVPGTNIFSSELPDRPHWNPLDPAVAGPAAVAFAALKASRQRQTEIEKYQDNLAFKALVRNIARQDKADVNYFRDGDFKGDIDVKRAFQIELLTLQTRVASLILAAHPTGFSTTGSDLIHDLFPV